MAFESVKVALHVVNGTIIVRFVLVASVEGENVSASAGVTAGGAQKEGAEAMSESRDEGKIEESIDPAALAEEYTLRCAKLQRTCEALCAPIPASLKPKVAALSDIKLKNVRSPICTGCTPFWRCRAHSRT
jgi:hypothetical protein